MNIEFSAKKNRRISYVANFSKSCFTFAHKHDNLFLDSLLNMIHSSSNTLRNSRVALRQIRPKGGREGFSLVEILTVLAIATLLASLSFPALSGIQSSRLGDSISELSDYVKVAQTVARSSNSYVWIGFAQHTNNLEVVALQGLTGVSTDLTNNQVQLLSKPLNLPNVVLDPTGKLPTESQAPPSSLVSMISTSALGSSGTFTFTVSGQTQTFSNVIGITPRGEAFLSGPTTFVHWLQIGVAPYPFNSTTGQMPSGKAPSNFAELYLAGLTGEVDVVRP